MLNNHPKRMAALVFLISTLMATQLGFATNSNMKIVPSTGSISLNWLRANGTQIMDSNGNVVSWRGVNVHDPRNSPLVEEDYIKMASWGIKIIRMPIEWSQIEPQPGIYNLDYLEFVDRQITLAKKYGLYIVLNVHQWYWSPHFTFHGSRGYGFPVWLVSEYPDTEDGWRDAVTDFWLGKGANGTEASSDNPSMIDRYISIWKLVAARYVNEPTIVSFDLFNEPSRGWLSPQQHAQYLYPFYEYLISEIREIDSNRLLNYQPTGGWGTPYARLIDKPNITFSFHFYELKNDYDGDSSKLETIFLNFWGPIKNWNIPIWVSEVGVELFNPNFSSWANDTLTIMTKYQLGWTWYAYIKSNYPAYALLYANGTEKTDITNILKVFF